MQAHLPAIQQQIISLMIAVNTHMVWNPVEGSFFKYKSQVLVG